MKKLTLTLALVLSAAASAHAATLLVPAHHASIQAAINAALPNDVVVVSGGTYFEDLWINNKSNLTLTSAPGETVIVNAGGFGVPLRIFGGVINGIRVKKMTFTNTTDAHGIWINNVSNVRIEKCTITNVAFDGVNVSFSSSVLVKKCEIDSPGRHGILTLNGGLRASGNRINFPVEDGIVLLGDQNEATANRSMSPSGNGISVGTAAIASANNLVQQNEVTLAGEDGVRCEAGATATTISDNVLAKCADDGIDIQIGADATVADGNRIPRAGETGMEISSDHSTFRDNRIKKPFLDGIWVSGASTDGTYDRNKVVKSTSDGFDVAGTGNLFRYNRGARSGTFDLNDHTAPGANTYQFNSFGTIAP